MRAIRYFERVKFLAITASNLDEFFMKRIGGLKQQAIAGMQELTVDGRTPQRQIAECLVEVREFEAAQRALLPELLKRLRESGIDILAFEQLSVAEQAAIREYYLLNIFPLMTPQAMDPAHPFLHLQPLAESAGYAARTRRYRALAGAGKSAGWTRHPTLRAG